MTEPDPSDATSPVVPPQRPRSPWPPRIAWVAIVLAVGFLVGVNLWASHSEWRREARERLARENPAAVRSMQLEVAARMAIGQREFIPSRQNSLLMAEQVRALAKTPLERVRAVPVLAELEGTRGAIEELDRLAKDPAVVGSTTRPSRAPEGLAAPADGLARDVWRLQTIYREPPASLSPADQTALARRHGWFGRLALSHRKPDSDPDRAAVLRPAKRAFVAWMCILLLGGGAVIVGLGLFITAMVFLANRRVRRAYRYPVLPPNGPYAPGLPMLAPRPAPPPAVYPGYYSYGQWPVGYQYTAPPGAPGPYGGYPGATAQTFPGYGAPYAAPSGAMPYSSPPPGYGYPAPVPVPSPGTSVSAEPPSVPPVPADSGPFLEAFAIYLCTQIVLMLIVALVFHSSRLETEWVLILFLPVWFLWPVLRGVSGAELRRGLGWHRGRGVLREITAGVGGYLGGLPLLVAAILVTSMLNRISHTEPEHPIQFEVGRGWWTTLQIYLLACVWAPIVEETMFRGALFHHLRQRWRWLAAAPLVAFLFAAIHPQGWTTIPVLGALAVTFAGIREWRGSIIGCMTAHFLQNFTVATFLILSMS